MIFFIFFTFTDHQKSSPIVWWKQISVKSQNRKSRFMDSSERFWNESRSKSINSGWLEDAGTQTEHQIEIIISNFRKRNRSNLPQNVFIQRIWLCCSVFDYHTLWSDLCFGFIRQLSKYVISIDFHWFNCLILLFFTVPHNQLSARSEPDSSNELALAKIKRGVRQTIF